MADDDSALIAQIRDGSERAFNVLIDRHQQAVRGFLRRLLADASDADDLAQETFMVAWTRPGSYRGDASVRSWLCAIAWRKARDAQRAWFRRRGREARWAGEADQIAAAPSPESAVVARALAELPLEQRAALVLCLIQDFSHGEAAVILGAPLGTVKSHVARGKARLLAALGGHPPSRLHSRRRDRGMNENRMDDEETRLVELLRRDLPPERDPLFRLDVLARRERHRFRRQLARALTIGAVSGLRNLVSPLLARVTQTFSRAFVD